MTLSFVVVPQWQGSPSTRALRLAEGAEAIRGDLPAASTVTVEVPAEAGDGQGSGVRRLGSIATVRDRLAQTLRERGRGPALVIGGDCGVELAAVTHAAQSPSTQAGGMAVIWCDAHPDLNAPGASPSGAFSGMVLRTLLGEGPPQLVPATPLLPSQVIVLGARSLDAAEAAYVAEAGIRMLGPTELDPETLLQAVAETGASSVYVHLDLDVLDPGEIQAVTEPIPFGLGVGALTELLRALGERYPLAGAGITGFAPSSAAQADDDLPTVLRLLGVLTRGLSRDATPEDSPRG